jgi:hypothetical protein
MASVQCPGRSERQFLPGQIKQAKRWAAQQTCSKKSLCPQERPCRENVFIVEREHYIDARVQCVCASSARAKVKSAAARKKSVKKKK